MIFPVCEKLGQTIIFVRTRETASSLHTEVRCTPPPPPPHSPYAISLTCTVRSCGPRYVFILTSFQSQHRQHSYRTKVSVCGRLHADTSASGTVRRKLENWWVHRRWTAPPVQICGHFTLGWSTMVCRV